MPLAGTPEVRECGNDTESVPNHLTSVPSGYDTKTQTT